jgi:putative DNA primase/helicase
MHNLTEIIEQFRTAALDNGIALPEHIKADGQRHRFNIDGKLNGFYKLHTDGRPAGCFQNWKLNDKPINWKFDGEFKPFTPEQRREYAQQRQEAERKRQAEQAAIHQNAARIWGEAPPALTHPYLTKKAIQPHGARLYGQALLLPLYNAEGRLMSLQFINLDGSKRFLKHGQKRGCYWWIGKPTEKILISEGYATAASLHESTGHRCFIAWDAGNLTPVAEIIRAKKPDATIVICADHDESGTGQREAEKAALAVDGFICMPPVPGLDFNDWANQPGSV